MKERPILVAVIGYMIGILWGLYFKFSIVPFCILILATFFLIKKFYKNNRKRAFKLLSVRRYSRYLKLLFNHRAMLIIMLSSIIANTNVLVQNKKYENFYQDNEKIQVIGIVNSQKIEKQYYDLYSIKLLNSKPFHLYIQVRKKAQNLNYGDQVKLQGVYKKPKKQKNYKGYNDAQYLKTLKIVGRMEVNKIEVIAKKQFNPVLQLANQVKMTVKEKIEDKFEKGKAFILKGILLGETTNIQEEIKEEFQISNISHILAISGMHINYLILGVQFILKNVIGKRKTKIITILILFFYVMITGFSPSIIRAVVMGSILIGGDLFHRKNDVWNSIAISLLGILCYNPFLILNIGLQLSYLGTIGIILIHPTILKILKGIRLKKIKEGIAVSISAQIAILPVLLYHFNSIGIYFLITNLMVSFVVEPIVLLGFFGIFSNIIIVILDKCIDVLLWIAKFSQLPYSKIYIATPSIITIILYYTNLGVMRKLYGIHVANYLTTTQKRVKNLIDLFRYQFRQKRKKYLSIGIVILIGMLCIFLLPRDLKIYFVDVGQGDCTFIKTPQNKTILIDGGGSLNIQFDLGKKMLLPYLLDRGCTSIDYVVISHLDQDHVGSILYLLKEIKVKNVIIGKQFEDCVNYQKFVQIVKEQKVKVHVVEAGSRIKIEKNLYFDILWPSTNNIINENSINNNSLVCKMVYQKFSVLFTGDIEEIAEKAILQKYKNINILESDILKIAHHGSKSSSTEEFLNVVKPKMVLIGVGKDNKFGHPNADVIKRLQRLQQQNI